MAYINPSSTKLGLAFWAFIALLALLWPVGFVVSQVLDFGQSIYAGAESLWEWAFGG